MTNIPDSHLDVVNTATHLLAEFEQSIVDEIEGVGVVLDERLSYETGVKQWMENNPESDLSIIPLFIYKRTVTKDSEHAPAKRGKDFRGIHRLGDNDVMKFSAQHGEFDIQFMFASQNVEVSEKFEVTYNSDLGISGNKEIVVDLPELGAFRYFLEYRELDDIEFETEGAFYRAIIGSIRVRGFYFTFTGKAGLIKKINARLLSTTNFENRIDENEMLNTTKVTGS